MSQVGQEGQTWPGGLTYVFQGTIAEDATAGTHICTATITPGQGTEFQVLYGMIIGGNTATAQVATVRVTDGTNIIAEWKNTTTTSASVHMSFPVGIADAVGGNLVTSGQPSFIVSGTMQLILQVSTAAVSVTQSFSVACRIHGAKPTVVLNDTIGTSTNTVNTDAVF